MRLLCIDLSTHTGYAVFEGEKDSKPQLMAHGTIHLNKSVFEFTTEGPYPYNYIAAAAAQVENIRMLLLYGPDLVVVEETNLGRNRYTQKLLEFLHYSLASMLKGNNVSMAYIDSSEWRSNLSMKMTKEQKKNNAKLSKAKRALTLGKKLDKAALGIKGKITAKHLAVERANSEYGLKLLQKDNDAADAIMLGLAWCNGAVICDGT